MVSQVYTPIFNIYKVVYFKIECFLCWNYTLIIAIYKLPKLISSFHFQFSWGHHEHSVFSSPGGGGYPNPVMPGSGSPGPEQGVLMLSWSLFWGWEPSPHSHATASLLVQCIVLSERKECCKSRLRHSAAFPSLPDIPHDGISHLSGFQGHWVHHIYWWVDLSFLN